MGFSLCYRRIYQDIVIFNHFVKQVYLLMALAIIS